MNNEGKSEKELIRDLSQAQQRITELEQAAAEHRLTEEALRRSEERFRRITENMSDLVSEINAIGEIVYASPSHLDILGEEPEKLIGVYLFDRVHPEDRDRVLAEYCEGIRTKIDREVEFRYQHSDGTYVWLRSSGHPLYDSEGEYAGAVINSGDITRRKKAEEELRRHRDHLEDLVKERTAELKKRNKLLEDEVALRKQMNAALHESEAKYRFLTEKMSDVIWTTDLDLNVTYVSPSIQRIRGFTPEERLQMKLTEVLTPGSCARAMETLRIELERIQSHGIDPQRVINIELEFYHKDGSIVWMDTVASAIYDDRGNLTGIHGVGRDITERKRAEEDKKKLENQLIQVQRIDALDRFAGGIAHDLNNILYPIIINIEQLLSETPVDSGHHEILSQTLKASYRQKDLIKKILAFSRKSEKAFSPMKVVPLLEETMDFLRSSLPSTIDIQCHCNAETDVIMGDSTMIQQVIMNLCHNAAYALDSQKGTIEVGLTNVHLEPAGARQDLPAGGYLQLTVRDTGVGMSPDVLIRIFEPFFTTKDVGHGTGMGLSVVHGIVKSHGGAVTVRSVEGEGSLFTVYLPICDTQCEDPVSSGDSIPPTKGKGKVLLIDDEEIILFSVQRVLKMSGYRVIALKDSLEALKLFEKKPREFDLVITDQTMPGITGIELSRKILDIRPDIPVILCTGYNEAISGDEAESIGIRELLLKPAGTSELKNIIRRALQN